MPRPLGLAVALLALLAAVLRHRGTASAASCLSLPAVTNLSLTFRVVQTSADGEETSWRLDAVGSWQRPDSGVSFTGYAARIFKYPFSYQGMPCLMDRTFTTTSNQSITFEGVDFGFRYSLRVALVDTRVMALRNAQTSSTAPDCYQTTRSKRFCTVQAVWISGAPADLRIDNMTRQEDGLVTVRASWAAPVQVNGAILFYSVVTREAGLLNNGFNGGTSRVFPSGKGDELSPNQRYEHTIADLPPYGNVTYHFTVIPVVRTAPTKQETGYNSTITFNTSSVIVSDATTQDSKIPGSSDSGVTDGGATKPPPGHDPQGSGESGPAPGPGPEATLPWSDAGPDPADDESGSTADTATGDGAEGAPTPAAPRDGGRLAVTASVAAGLGLGLAVTLGLATWACLRRKRKEDELKKAVFIRTREEEISMYHHKGLDKHESDYREVLPEFEATELDRTLLKLEKELGSGQFGVVYKGYAFGVYDKEEYSPVAVKSLKRNASMAMKEDFLDEIKLIIEMGSHPNILSVLGCCTVDEPYYLVTEFMQYGDLLHFLWRCRPENRPNDDAIFVLTETNKIQIARQITRGMEYLSSTRYYHGDLAARNVLVGAELVVKVSDFGLADDIYQNGYKRLAPQRKRPVKWVSMETNLEGKCTIQSDVWSFGIVLYEVYTLGSMPYPGLDGRDVIRRLQTGYRMEKPDNCPDEIYDIMRQCWREKPADRPTFTNLFNSFDKMLVSRCDYMPLEGVVYDHCIPTDGPKTTRCGEREAEGEDEGEQEDAEEGQRREGALGVMAMGQRPAYDEDEFEKIAMEQSDTTMLFQEGVN